MIRINLTGDYLMSHPTGNTSDRQELVHLDAFLGALRGSVDSNAEVFLKSISDTVSKLRRKNFDNIAVQVTSELVCNKLIHEFRIVELDKKGN